MVTRKSITIFLAICTVLVTAEPPTGYDYPRPSQPLLEDIRSSSFSQSQQQYQSAPSFDILLTGSGGSSSNQESFSSGQSYQTLPLQYTTPQRPSFDQGYQYSRPVAEPIIRPVKSYTTQPTQQYVQQVKTYSPPVQQYVQQVKPYSRPVQQYIQPVQQHYVAPRPVQQYIQPVQQQYVAPRPVQQYIRPVQQHYVAPRPVQQYIQPVQQQYVAPRPVQQYIQPVQQQNYVSQQQVVTRPAPQYVQPVQQQYIQPVQQYVQQVKTYSPPIQPQPYVAPAQEDCNYNIEPVKAYVPPVQQYVEPVRTYTPPAQEISIPAQPYISQQQHTSYEAPIVPIQQTFAIQETPKFDAQIFKQESDFKQSSEDSNSLYVLDLNSKNEASTSQVTAEKTSTVEYQTPISINYDIPSSKPIQPARTYGVPY